LSAPATRARAVAAVLLAAALFGTTGTAQALGPTSTTPLGVGATRLVVGGLVLLAVLPVVGVRPSRAVALWRTPTGLVAGLCTALYQLCFFAGVQRAGEQAGCSGSALAGPGWSPPGCA
jgi:DME family drug/metabolite transporter